MSNAPEFEISFDEARRRVLTAFSALPAETVDVRNALNAVLAESIASPIDLPRFTNAAMDGYAVRSADIGSSPDLPIAASIAAGDPVEYVLPDGFAVRIMTGAPLPTGADSVIPFELAHLVSDSVVRFNAAPVWGANVRWAGDHLRAGQSSLTAGTIIRPAQMAVLSSIGVTKVRVHRRPRIALLATGDEVIAPGGPLGPSQTWDATSAALAAMVIELGAIPVSLGIARDHEPDLLERIAGAVDRNADLLITTGGVSAGDFDLVKRVLQRRGDVEAWSIRMKPGRPLAFGTIGAVPTLGLPGNPVAALVAFLQFARPAILAMLGVVGSARDLTEVPVTAMDTVENRGGRRNFTPVTVRITAAGFGARALEHRGSADILSFAGSDGLMVIPESVERVEPGMRLMAQMPGWTRM